MKEFFRRYNYDFVPMLLDQVAISMFGFALAMTANRIQNDTLLMITSIGSIIFYLALLYGAARKVGAKDRTTVELGHRKFRPFTGTWISLIANTPNLIVALVIMIRTLSSADQAAGGIPRAIALLMQGMYQGLLATISVGGTAEEPVYINTCWWVYFLIILPAVLVSTVGYIAGVRDWHLTPLVTPELPASDRPTRKEKKEARQSKKK